MEVMSMVHKELLYAVLFVGVFLMLRTMRVRGCASFLLWMAFGAGVVYVVLHLANGSL